MVLKSSILACVLAGVVITHALPMSGNKITIDERDKKLLPTALPAAAILSFDQQFVGCLINTLYNPPKDQNDRLKYGDLINGCRTGRPKERLPGDNGSDLGSATQGVTSAVGALGP
ncbi:hypothetical protein BCR42DRAFT_397455 [Absidia repens]|uniref:Uncharacterized protein n=1 Tax=Absidia repens TaxID=90262 RepID=A0A1X2I1I8_9FUNG|nr:hypothetical protein BCR42DRAFT_397455 [Absidia repens]